MELSYSRLVVFLCKQAKWPRWQVKTTLQGENDPASEILGQKPPELPTVHYYICCITIERYFHLTKNSIDREMLINFVLLS